MATIINGSTNTTSSITLSNSQILQNLITSFSNLIQINQYTLDSSDTSFINYLFNNLSILFSDSLFYMTNIAKESTLVTAQLPTSIYNWASYIGYTPGLANPSTTDINLSIVMNEGFTSNIPQGFAFSTNSGIVFTTDNEVIIDTTNGASVYYIDASSGIEYPLPFNMVYNTNNTSASNTNSTLDISVPVTQQFIIQEQFTIPSLQPLQTYTYSLTLPDGEFPVETSLQITDNNGNTTVWSTGIIVSASSLDYVYQVSFISSVLTIEFGNGVQGVQPQGLANLNITVTNGNDGNVLSGTINSGSTIYSNTQPPQPVTYTVTNTDAATGGSDSESLESTRTNAPISLNMLDRVVSGNDYQNILTVMGLNQTTTAYMQPVIKRSDLATNEIYLYTVPLVNNLPIESDTIAYDITDIYNTNTTSLYPTQVISAYDPLSDSTISIDWVNLFLIDMNYQTNAAEYYYLQSQIIPTAQSQYISSESNNYLNTIVVNYNMYTDASDTYTINIYMLIQDPNLVYGQSIQILQGTTYNTYTPLSCQRNISNQAIFTYTLTRDQVSNMSNMEINTTEAPNETATPVMTTQYYTSFQIKTPLNNIEYSYIMTYNNKKYLLDIPVISASYYQSLTSASAQANFIDNIVGQFMANVNSIDMRMLNTNVSAKFARTYGTIVNNMLSTPNFYVQNILTGYQNGVDNIALPTDASVGNYYAISDPISSSDPLYSNGGSLLIWNGVSWVSKNSGVGTTVLNLSNNLLYQSDGRRWTEPDQITLPLNINLGIHLSVSNSSIYDTITTAILNYTNNLGIGTSFYLSELINAVQSISGVSYVRPITPLHDIIYNDVSSNLSQIQVQFYTPEYIYTTSDNITLTII
jgi:hypothetical protein